MWKPFKYVLKKYYKELGLQTSLVETFATFILLSSVKIASVSLFLLVPVTLYNEQGHKLPKKYLFIDSNVECLVKNIYHMPFLPSLQTLYLLFYHLF